MPEIQRESIEEPAAKKMKVDSSCVLRWAKLTEHALEPVRGSKRAAGFDLRSAYNVTVPARGKAVVKTDLQIHVPEGSYGRVAPRSGLAVKNFIDVGAGVVDEDYRGNLGVVLFNHSESDFEVKIGDRIAQLICERIFYPELEQVDKLEDTERGESGFGSTGINKVTEKNGNTKKEDTEKNGSAKKDDTEKNGSTKDAADKSGSPKEAVAKNGSSKDAADKKEITDKKGSAKDSDDNKMDTTNDNSDATKTATKTDAATAAE